MSSTRAKKIQGERGFASGLKLSPKIAIRNCRRVERLRRVFSGPARTARQISKASLCLGLLASNREVIKERLSASGRRYNRRQ